MQTSGAPVSPFFLSGSFAPSTAFHVNPVLTTYFIRQPLGCTDVRPLWHRTKEVEGGTLPRRGRCIHQLKAFNEAQPTLQGNPEVLETLSRRQLQSLCKTLGLRAIGKTEDLKKRLAEALEQSSESGSIGALSPNTNDATLRGTPYRLPRFRLKDGEETQISSDSLSGVVVGDIDAEIGRDEDPAEELEERHPPPCVSDSSTRFDQSRWRVPVSLERLSQGQREQITQLAQLMTEWNEKINLVSRKDIANVYHRHLLPCVEMALALEFEDDMTVLDMGTGGGLPGLPLAICLPNVLFTLIDGTGKKIMAVNDMVRRLGLNNVRAYHVRAEDVYDTFDYVVGRAVCSIPKFIQLVEKNLRRNDATDGGSRRAPERLKRGVLYMRGTATLEELAELGAQPAAIVPLDTLSREEGGDADVQDRGYSSVFHFVSEDIFRRSAAEVQES